jgi:flagellar biosynthesis protein
MPGVSAALNDGLPCGGACPGRGATNPRCESQKVTEQDSSTARSSLAIALENVTPEALARRPGADASGATGTVLPAGGPRVIASGRGAVAEQILQIAFERGVKVRSDADLAEILSVVEIDSEIPLAALAGVAEILRYLYHTDKPGGPSGARSQQDPAARPTDEESSQ